MPRGVMRLLEISRITRARIFERGGEGWVIASFEHNSSEHAIARPHVHNLIPSTGK